MGKVERIIYAVLAIILLVVVWNISSQRTAKKYKETNLIEQKETILKGNRKLQKALIINDSLQAEIAKRETIRVKEFTERFVEPPETDANITPWWEQEEWLPDESIDVEDIIKSNNWSAVTLWKYRDGVNDYGLDTEIIFHSKTHDFEIVPQNVIFEPVKEYPFAGGVYASTRNSYGGWVDYDLWLFRVGGSFGVVIKKDLAGDLKLAPEGMVKIGFKFRK